MSDRVTTLMELAIEEGHSGGRRRRDIAWSVCAVSDGVRCPCRPAARRGTWRALVRAAAIGRVDCARRWVRCSATLDQQFPVQSGWACLLFISVKEMAHCEHLCCANSACTILPILGGVFRSTSPRRGILLCTHMPQVNSPSWLDIFLVYDGWQDDLAVRCYDGWQ